ncbi:MAG TPA: hypothetical protein VF556_07645 [Pyrinomonadaceae bacterium]|jgi:hypothetical protein
MKKNSYTLLLKIERQRKIFREQAEADKPVREIIGVEISADYGENWKLHALCTDCLQEIEPPLQRHKLGAAHTKTCDWCGARNVIRK